MKKLLSIMLAVLLTLTAAIPAMADYLPTEGEVGKVYTETLLESQNYEGVEWPQEVDASTTVTATSDGDAFKSVAYVKEKDEYNYSGYYKIKKYFHMDGWDLTASTNVEAYMNDYGLATDKSGNNYFHTAMYTNKTDHKKTAAGIKSPYNGSEISDGVFVLNYKIKLNGIENYDEEKLHVYAYGVKPDSGSTPYCCLWIEKDNLKDNEWNNVTVEIYMDETYPNIAEKNISYRVTVNGKTYEKKSKALVNASDDSFTLSHTVIVTRLYADCPVSVDDVKSTRLAQVTQPITTEKTLVAEKNAKVYAGSTTFGAEANPPQGSFEYVTLNAQKLGYGLKTINIVSKSENSAKTATVNVNFGKTVERAADSGGIYKGIVTSQSFDTGLSDTLEYNTSNGQKTYSDLGIFMYNLGAKKAPGRHSDTNQSDYSMHLEVPSDGRNDSWSNYYITPDASGDKWNNKTLRTDGKTRYEFDVMIGDADTRFRLGGHTSWSSNNGTFLIRDGKVLGSNYAITPQKWYHFDMTLDFTDAASNSGKGHWTINVTDEDGVTTKVIDGLQSAAAGTSGKIQLGPQGEPEGYEITDGTFKDENAFRTKWVRLDNLRIWNETTNAVSAVKAAGSDACGVVKATDTALTVEFDSSVQATGAAATLNGAAVTPSFSADGKTVTIPLTGLSAHTDAEIVLTGLSGFETTPVSIALRVADKDGFYFKAEQSNAANGMVTVPVFFFNAGGEDKDISVLAASYRDNELTGISVLEYAADENLTAAEFELDEISSGDTVRIFLWNTLTDASPLQTFEAITK